MYISVFKEVAIMHRPLSERIQEVLVTVVMSFLGIYDSSPYYELLSGVQKRLKSHFYRVRRYKLQ